MAEVKTMANAARDRLSVEARRDAGLLRLAFRGCIDEHTDLERLLPTLDRAVEIDLSGVERINSLGVRLWVNFLKQATARRPITLVRCAESMVTQFSVIPNTCAAATIGSVMAPYRCESCDHSEPHVLLASELDAGSLDKLPARRCTDCGGPSRFDDLPDVYFEFLHHPGH
jgi:anti-anti-sigma regulatory factor